MPAESHATAPAVLDPAVQPAPPLDERAQRIIAVAVELAERDGYEAVRLRDLADRAGVALATVYRRFACKEDILAAALDQQVAVAAELLQGADIPGDGPEERLQWFFRMSTQLLEQQPKLAAAMLRTVACGVPEVAERITRYRARVTTIILTIYRGEDGDTGATPDERMLAHLLQNVWYGGLVGWTGGVHDAETILVQTDAAIRLLVAGHRAVQATDAPA